jgi:hypothetical protein
VSISQLELRSEKFDDDDDDDDDNNNNNNNYYYYYYSVKGKGVLILHIDVS